MKAWTANNTLEPLQLKQKVVDTLQSNLGEIDKVGELVKIRMVANSNYLLLKYIKDGENWFTKWVIYDLQTGDEVF